MLIAAVILCVSLALTGCGGSGGGSGSGGSGDAGGAEDGKPLNEGEPGDYKIPEYRGATFDEGKAQGAGGVKLDTSHVETGYVSLKSDSDKEIKFQVISGNDKYTYDVRKGKKQVFPLTSGNGKYSFHVMENVEGNSYAEIYKASADVKLKDKFQPYTRPNQYADYDKDSKCVKIAKKLAKQATNESDFVAKVYDYVCANVEYDYELAKNIPSDYVPDPDKTIKEKKGICFSYASLAASMLRSQGIPTKIIFGYVAPDDIYHAWNMFYTKEQGWVTVDFQTNKKDWNRLDLTFAAVGSDNEFIGDGSNYQEVYQY